MDSSSSRFIDGLHALGVVPGDTLLVHSSLRSLGFIPGAAVAVIEALRAALGPSGTLLMPALSYEFVHARQPLFSASHTSSCVGTIPETFRTMPGVLRSVHPTHSVSAHGPRAAELTCRHHLDTTPVGLNSPFTQLAATGGKILMLGCGLRPNTSMHGVEELVLPEYLLLPDPVTYYLCDERGWRQVTHLRHDFRGYVQRYDRIEQADCGAVRTGSVLTATCHLIDAARMWKSAEAALRRDPLFFVDKHET